MKLKRYIAAIAISVPVILLVVFSTIKSPQSNVKALSPQFTNYWYQGKAEISSYILLQSRYGQICEGNAVMIYVTEDFLNAKNVKKENHDIGSGVGQPVLKLNFTKDFTTGIYPYHMMLSVFSPVNENEYAFALKTSGTVQEWCGQAYAQTISKNNSVFYLSHSYFQNENDFSTNFKKVVQEDELWNIIRLNPKMLPLGEVDILPGIWQQRLRHSPIEILEASCLLSNVSQLPNWLSVKVKTVLYSIQYKKDKRKLNIYFEDAFPHKILGWEETYYEGKNSQNETTTRAIWHKTLITDYWNKNKNEFLFLRDSLGLKKL